MRQATLLDEFLATANRALATLGGRPLAQRTYPVSAERGTTDDPTQIELSDEERRLSAALMRVNHVGEICAQALYEAQALGAREGELKESLLAAARDEADHLAWTQRRIEELGGRTSLLNPLWYAGAFSIGLLAARAGDEASLGFVAETERQVEQHLDGHLGRLPEVDRASRRIVEQMRDDEVQHGRTARALGGIDLPLPVRWAMKAAAKVMTTTAHYI